MLTFDPLIFQQAPKPIMGNINHPLQYAVTYIFNLSQMAFKPGLLARKGIHECLVIGLGLVHWSL